MFFPRRRDGFQGQGKFFPRKKLVKSNNLEYMDDDGRRIKAWSRSQWRTICKETGVVDDCNIDETFFQLTRFDIFPFPLDENCLKFWILFPSHSISSKISFSRKGKLVVIDEKREASRREKEEQRIETGNGIGSFHYLFNTPTPNNNLADAIIDRNLYSACCYFISRRQRHRCRAIIAADNEQLRLQSLPSTHYHLSARAFIIRSNEIVSMIIRTI